MNARSTSQLVSEVLDEYGDATRTALAGHLNAGNVPSLDRMVADYPRRGGRMMRSSLCIATARAFGGGLEHALQTAVAIELLHNAFLVHDDIEDESEERRGKPTLHAQHGIAKAVNAGDALLMTSLRPLLDNVAILGPTVALRVLEETARMASHTVEGQALELEWREQNTRDLGDQDYLDMILKKTCWYTMIHPCRVGALIGTGSALDAQDFVRFGFFLGAAFQIQDDLLNLVGDAEHYGKELCGDLQEGKRTLMLMHTMREAPLDEREHLYTLFGLPRAQRTREHVRWIRERMDATGSIDYAREVAQGLAGAALHEFDLLFASLPESRDRDFVEGLVRWVFERL